MPPRPRSKTEQPVSTLETFGRGGTRASEMDPIPPPRPTGQSERQSSHAPADLPAFPDVAYRRQNPGPLPGGNWVAPGAPARQNELETWVSPGGRRAVTREPNGVFRSEDGRFAPKPPGNWRRISSADDVPSSSGPVNALMG